jgi:hypothetical protein
MMDDINFYLTDIDDTLENLICDDSQGYNGDYKRMNIYNKNITKQLQKVWLLTPKLKLLGKIFIPSKTKQIAFMSLILYELDHEIRKLNNSL